MEIFDVYNDKGERIGKTIPRGSRLGKGEFHLVVHIWIKNTEGKYLVQKRNKKTDKVPGQYAATGGAVTRGEDSITGAIRETEEELGIKIQKDKFTLLKRYFVPDENAGFITDLYIVHENILLSELKLDYNEVKSCEYFTMDEIKQLIKENMFWNYERQAVRKGYFELLEKS